MNNTNSPYITTTRLLRLIYYNDALLKNGTITKREYEKINMLIISKYGKNTCNQLDIYSVAKRNKFE